MRVINFLVRWITHDIRYLYAPIRHTVTLFRRVFYRFDDKNSDFLLFFFLGPWHLRTLLDGEVTHVSLWYFRVGFAPFLPRFTPNRPFDSWIVNQKAWNQLPLIIDLTLQKKRGGIAEKIFSDIVFASSSSLYIRDCAQHPYPSGSSAWSLARLVNWSIGLKPLFWFIWY